MANSQIDYTINLKDVVKTLFSMISGKENSDVQKEKDIEDKLKEIQKVEKDIGATEGINSLEKQLLEVGIKKSRKKANDIKKTTKTVTSVKQVQKSNNVRKDKEKDDKIQEL